MKKASKYIWTILVIGMSLGITACGAGTTSDDDTVEVGSDNNTNTEAVSEENEDIVISENTEDSEIEENEDEIADETETQSVVYEGIDMDSTLPGLEWIETFNGVIEEPKLVIFNDETNKKIILENDQKIDFSEGDNLLIYAPIGKSAYLREGQSDPLIFDEITIDKYYRIMSKLSVQVHDGDEIPLRYDITGDYEYTLTATLVAVLNN
jgi:hypothetical protein